MYRTVTEPLQNIFVYAIGGCFLLCTTALQAYPLFAGYRLLSTATTGWLRSPSNSHDDKMITRAIFSCMLLVVSGLIHADELMYRRDELCGKCPSGFDPGPATSEKGLCTTKTPYTISVSEVTLDIQGKNVTGRFEFQVYRLFGDDTNNLYCQGFKSISGEFHGKLMGKKALVAYRHSWNDGDDFDSAEILIEPESIQWRSIGSQHGYLGMMPSTINLQRRQSATTKH